MYASIGYPAVGCPARFPNIPRLGISDLAYEHRMVFLTMSKCVDHPKISSNFYVNRSKLNNLFGLFLILKHYSVKPNQKFPRWKITNIKILIGFSPTCFKWSLCPKHFERKNLIIRDHQDILHFSNLLSLYELNHNAIKMT